MYDKLMWAIGDPFRPTVLYWLILGSVWGLQWTIVGQKIRRFMAEVEKEGR